ncbi:MAG TPA: D-2-hydroxyacid dehydrogenase [Terriglobales bacterium]
MKILIVVQHRFELWNAPPWLASRLKERFPEHDFVQLASLENISDEIKDADILIGYQFRAEQLRQARRLKYIHATTAAVHQLLFPEVVQSNIRITNSTEVHGPVVAEHAIGMVLSLAKSIPAAVRHQLNAHWGQQQMWAETPPREVAGATLGVIGLGSIGNEVARLAKSLGMRVVAMREHPERGPGHAGLVYGPAELDRLLREAEYIVLAAPLTEKTEALFDDAAFSRMRRDAYLINVGRGKLIDEDALERALRERRIAGAALDVFVTEPLPAESPLWRLDNLVITPHTGAVTDKLWERHFARISENLRRFFAGEPLLGEVDKNKGY